jgi:hypothetical protein
MHVFLVNDILVINIRIVQCWCVGNWKVYILQALHICKQVSPYLNPTPLHDVSIQEHNVCLCNN